MSAIVPGVQVELNIVFALNLPARRRQVRRNIGLQTNAYEDRT